MTWIPSGPVDRVAGQHCDFSRSPRVSTENVVRGCHDERSPCGLVDNNEETSILRPKETNAVNATSAAVQLWRG